MSDFWFDYCSFHLIYYLTAKIERMKALILNEDKTLSFQEVKRPDLLAGHVLVNVKAAALNHREIWIQKGLYPGLTLPCILGADGAGVVVEVADDVDSSMLGQEVIIYPGYDWGDSDRVPTKKFRVLGMPDPGTIAEYIAVPASNAVAKPDYLSWAEAAAIPVASLTAWRALVRHGNIDANSKVLITGIGGGVAQAGLGIAKAFGAEIFVTSSGQEKIDAAVAHGASGGVNYRDEDWHSQMKALSRGIDIVLDSSPSPVLDGYFKFMNVGGRIVTYGSTGSPQTTISISKFFLRQIQFIGTTMGSPREFEAMLKFMAEHKVKPHIHSKYSFEASIDAIEALKEGKQVGKIVIT